MSTDFRVGYLAEEGEPLAVFLDSAAESSPRGLMVYSRIGEHSEADIRYLQGLPPAGEEQYRPLHTYLSRRYADGPGESLNLVIDQEGLPR